MKIVKKYKHWLKINGYTFDEKKQYSEIEKYLNNYPNAKATIYQYDFNLFNKVVLLECEQNYDGLDIDVNSGSNNLRRLVHKSKNISKPKIFEVPDYLNN